MYLMRTGIAASRSESRASLRIGHQSYKKISRGRHMETQPPIVRLSRTISPIRLPFIKAARKSRGYRHLVEAERLRSRTISRAQKELILIQ